ncbi:LysE family translocator [Flagellimonas sp. S174]|uniref:LysE family translocator n=1 Tax=Flagellimonas sp. S174 TaxID=3410790 RepID=UPI003BF4C08E
MLETLLIGLTISYPVLGGFVLSTAILGISPGPDNIFVLTQSLANGVKSGLAVVLGLASGCLVHTTLLAFGVSEIIKRSDTLFWLIKLFGVAYLLYLAFKVFRSEAKIEISASKTSKQAPRKLFWTGFTMNVLNPKVTIFFLAFFPGFLFSTDMNHVVQFYVLGFLFIVVTLIIFGSIAMLSGSISKFVTKNVKAGIVLKWTQIFVFVGIAVYLLLS